MNPIAPPMMPPTNQSMTQGGVNPMMAGLPEDVIKKVLKSVSETVSMQASEAIQSGVPWGHVIDELVKMAPPSTMNNNQIASGGGNGGPSGPNGNGGGNTQPPMQPGGGPMKREDVMMTPQSTQDNSNLGSMLANSVQGQQQSQTQQVQQPFQGGPNREATKGFFDPGAFNSDTNTIRMPGGFMTGWGQDRILKQQEIMGMKPLQAADREKAGLDYQKAIQTEILKHTLDLETQGMLKPNDIFTKFEQASQPFILQRDAYDRIVASAKDPSPAGDLALIYNYMKLLDPGSTVREGEFATAQNSGSIPSRIWAQYNKVMNGQRLNKDQRADFVGKSGSIFKSAESQQRKTTDQFSSLAKRNGLDPKRILRDTGLNQASSKYVKTGTHDGQKVGMKEDGTVEVISG